ncbi:MAG: DUF3014 domain-containing protein [Bdellovibrionales bacterium]|nr:DUF3014 domain-containing protein [Oligoflexia bacterium]
MASKNSKSVGLGIAVLVGVVLGLAYYEISHKTTEIATPPPVVVAVSPSASPNQAEAPASTERYPPPKKRTPTQGAKTLPALEESDLTLEEILANLVGKDVFQKLFFKNEMISRLVATVDNAKNSTMPTDLLPFHPVPHVFKVIHKGEQTFMDPKNYERYLPYVKMLETVDVKKLADIYFEFYPLIQDAYRETSPEGYFNDRVIATIDNLVSTPEVKEPIELNTLNKSYQYTDKSNEELTAGQKVLVRMGPESARKMKTKLSQLRNILILGQ